MTYSATIIQLLLSSPSDLPDPHKEVVVKAIRVWNDSHGRRFGVHYSPTNWEEGSSPEYGVGPQESLNKQVVDTSDLGLVIFSDRIGTPTKSHTSGTVEEIERLHEQGKRVAILRNRYARQPPRGTDGAQQTLELEQYLTMIRDRALYREYGSLDELLGIVSALLTDEALKFEAPATVAETPAELAENDLAKGVWPSVDTERPLGMDPLHRGMNRTRRYLVLTNATGVPATNVSYLFEQAEEESAAPFDLRPQDHKPLQIMAPNSAQRFPLLRASGSPKASVCVVTWTDPEGRTRETRATVVAQ